MYGQQAKLRFGGPITPVVKKLLIINGALFLFQLLFKVFSSTPMEGLSSFDRFFGLNHDGFILSFKLWQVFTYMFLHGGWMHIIFNLIGLWMFAGELEQLWGSRFFLKYYIYSGIGAGVFIALLNILIFSKYNAVPTTIGASGAIYGILLAYGLTWPNREVLLWMIIPIKMKYVVLFFGIFEFFGTLTSVSGGHGNISHIGHLGGLLTGLFIILMRPKIKSSTASDFDKGNFITRMFRKARLKKKQKSIENRIKAKQIIDDLLEKIARTGMSSLTSEEKKRLEWARKHYYPEGKETLH